MGAWEHGNLENDTAADFLASFREEPTVNVLVAPILLLNNRADDDKELDASDCYEALAAAEIIAASRNRPLPGFPADIQQLAIELRLPEWDKYPILMQLTRRAVGVTVEESELRELMSDTREELMAWEQIQQGLQQRLASNLSYDRRKEG